MSQYGSLTAAAIGALMKEMVRRAILIINAERFSFEASGKMSHDGNDDDFVTTADREAQRVYEKLIREWFPGFGIVAEEEELSEPCRIPGVDLYFTVDPLDGTKAFIRGESSRIGTMIALICDGKVIAAYIGDVNTGEIFGFRPESPRTHWITKFQYGRPLRPQLEKPLGDQYVLLRDPVNEYTVAAQRIATPGNVFKSHEIGGGSIGVQFTRLWRGEVGGLILRPSWETPWDRAPIIGISEHLGFVFYKITPGGRLVIEPNKTEKKKYRRDHELLVVHEQLATQLIA